MPFTSTRSPYRLVSRFLLRAFTCVLPGGGTDRPEEQPDHVTSENVRGSYVRRTRKVLSAGNIRDARSARTPADTDKSAGVRQRREQPETTSRSGSVDGEAALK